MSEPRIYVASLSDYNAGVLHGAWINCDDADEMYEAVRAMLESSPTAAREGAPAEEWAIHDHDGFGGVRVDEFETFERVAEWAGLLAEHGPAFAAYVAHIGADYASGDEFVEAYCGEWESGAAYAEQTATDAGVIPDGEMPWPLYCIDWSRAWRELECGDYYSVAAPGGNVYIFRAV